MKLAIKTNKWLLGVMVLLLLCRNHPASAGEQGLESRIATYVELMLKAEQIKGLSMGFVGPGGASWAAGFGYVNMASSTKGSQYTVYPVASLTKLITSMAIMQLVDDGKLELDAPVSDYLPDFSIQTRFQDQSPITIRHLLSHHGGLPRDLFKGLMAAEPDARPDLLDYLSGQYMVYPPQAKYVYSNLGYDLLELVIERVSGQAFKAFVKDNVLKPLDMHDSFFYAEGADMSGLSRAYIRQDQYHYQEYPQRQHGSSGLYSTAHDMTQILTWLLSKGHMEPSVSADLFGKMLSDQKSSKTLDVSFKSGWSWILEALPGPSGGIYAYQLGSTMHYNAVMAIVPAHQVGVILLCNTGGVLEVLEEMAKMIVMAALMEEGKMFSETKSVAAVDLATPNAEDIQRVKGHFLLQTDLFSITEMANQVVLSSGGQTIQTAFHQDGWFSIEDSFRFTTSMLEDTSILVVDRLGSIYPVGSDISGSYRLPPDVFTRLGYYALEGVDPKGETMIYSGAWLDLKDGILQLQLLLSPHQERVFGYGSALYNLIPKSQHEAVIAGFGMYKGETVFFGEDTKGPYLMFSGLFFRLEPATEPG